MALLFVAATWLPGSLPTGGGGWAMVAAVVAVVVLFAVGVRLKLHDRDDRALWPAFRKVRRPVRRALVALLLAAVAALVMSVLHGDGRYQEPEARAGRYYASKVTGERARVEVSMAVYGAVREGEQRMILSAASCVAALGVPAWHSPRGRCAGPTRAFRLV